MIVADGRSAKVINFAAKVRTAVQLQKRRRARYVFGGRAYSTIIKVCWSCTVVYFSTVV